MKKVQWTFDIEAENQEGEGGELWKDNPHKKCHKDIDARWTKKREETFYVYKYSVAVCKKTKLIHGYSVCAANRHDSKETDKVLANTKSKKVGEELEADAG